MRACHKEDGIFHYKEKTGQGYTKCPAEEEDVFELEKYYRWNKTFTQLKRTIYRIKNLSKSDYEFYICVVYSINSDSYSKTVHDWEVREHGNYIMSTISPYRPNNIKMPGYTFDC